MKGDCFGTLRCRIKLGPQRTISPMNLCKQASEPMLDRERALRTALSAA